MKATKFDRRVSLVALGIALVSITAIYAMCVVKEVRR
jgi:hypothetical protein